MPTYSISQSVEDVQLCSYFLGTCLTFKFKREKGQTSRTILKIDPRLAVLLTYLQG